MKRIKKIAISIILILAVISLIGCSKTVKYSSGITKYTGEWKDGKANGEGIEYYENGQVKYTGAFKDGLYSGSGTVFYENGKTKYKGMFVSGNYDGYGILYDEEPKYMKSYEGEFANGLFDGKGVMYAPEGERLEGVFSQAYLEGQGILFDKDGNKLFEGTFKKSSMIKGTLFYPDGSKKYEGEVDKDGNPNGKGALYNKSGKVNFSGNFLNGNPDYTYIEGHINGYASSRITLSKTDENTIDGTIKYEVGSYRAGFEITLSFNGYKNSLDDTTESYKIMYDSNELPEYTSRESELVIKDNQIIIKILPENIDPDGYGTYVDYFAATCTIDVKK